MITRILQPVIRLLFPRLCLACMEKSIPKSQILCISCLTEMPYTDHFINPENKVIEHFYGRIPIVHGAALLYFGKSSKVQNMLHNFKYKGETIIGKRLGKELGQKIMDSLLFPDLDIIIPIPMHKDKRRFRGFNQTEILAESIQDVLGISYAPNVLTKLTNTESQTNKNRTERQKNVENSIGIQSSEKIKGKNILLVDDVITTGSTAGECGEVLLKNGAKSISVVTAGAATTSFL